MTTSQRGDGGLAITLAKTREEIENPTSKRERKRYAGENYNEVSENGKRFTGKE